MLHFLRVIVLSALLFRYSSSQDARISMEEIEKCEIIRGGKCSGGCEYSGSKKCTKLSDCYNGTYVYASWHNMPMQPFCHPINNICCIGPIEYCDENQQIITVNQDDCTKDGDGNPCINKEGQMGICKQANEFIARRLHVLRCCPDLSESKNFADFITRMDCDEKKMLSLQQLKAYCKNGFIVSAGTQTLQKPGGAVCNYNSECEPNHYCMRVLRGQDARCYYVAPKDGKGSEKKTNENDGNNIVLIIIIVVVIIVLALIACAGAGFYFYRKKRAARKAGENKKAASKPTSKMTPATASTIMSPNPKSKFPSKTGTTTTSPNPNQKFASKPAPKSKPNPKYKASQKLFV